MSHTTTLKTSIKDVRAIRQAAKECGVELLENVKPRMYFADQQKHTSEYVLKLKGRYDVGLNKQPDGSYALAFDPWGGDIHKELGNAAKGANATVGKFLQSYAKHAAINAATAKGYSVSGTSVDKHGNINLILNVPG
jgi:hypothetical protein